MTTPATPQPPAPVPPEGYVNIPPEWLESNPVPMDAIVACGCGLWSDSKQRGNMLPSWREGGLHYATRAPLPAEPTASESSGDVHLRQARERIAELEKQLATETQIHKGELKESANILAGLEQDLAAAHTSLELYTGTTLRLESELREERTLSGQLMIERDEAKAISQKHGERTKELARQLEQRGIDLDAALARAETAERERDEMKARWQGAENSNAMAIGALEALATSPAPIAVGEKDSAGPTPRTDAFSYESSSQIPGGGNADMGDVHDHAARIADFARTLERELTASESLRREAWKLIESAPHSPTCDRVVSPPLEHAKCTCWLSRLTPPVAGEGGEGGEG
jgi:hypothetical protein